MIWTAVFVVVAGLAIAAAFVGQMGAQNKLTDRRRAAADAIAEETGLQVLEDLSLQGSVDGVYLYLSSGEDELGRAQWRVRFSLPAYVEIRWSGPLSTQVTTGLDDHKVQQVLANDAVARMVELAKKTGIRVEVNGPQFLLVGPSDLFARASPRETSALQTRIGDEPVTYSVQGGIRLAVLLHHAVVDAWTQPWVQVSESLGLTRSDDASTLEGKVDGVSITIAEDERDGLVQTIVSAPVEGLPPDTRVVHEVEGDGDSQLGGFAARFLHGTTSDPEALNARLEDTNVRESLLSVLHGHPGSVLTTDAVRLRLPKKALAHELGAAIHEVADLVNALRS